MKWRNLLALLPGYDPFAAPAGAWFDADAAQLALDFFPECLTHVEGALVNHPFRLEPWQQSFVANLFGWKRTDRLGREVRRYREALLYLPRKSGKTPLAAAIALYVFFCDPEKGQQDYIAAADKEQAGMLFRYAKGMVVAEPSLASRCRIYGGTAAAGQSKSIVREADHSFLRVVSADADTRHGGNSHLVIVDELHAQPDRELVDVLTTSTASLNRAEPLTLFITTADFERPSICNEKHEYAKRVMKDPAMDPAFLPAVYEAKPDADWTSRETWAAANPNLGVSVSEEYLERECGKAKDIAEYENTFKRLHLNLKTKQDCRWLSESLWAACDDLPCDPAPGARCFAGLDLANTLDLAALALVFPPADPAGVWQAKLWFWAPEAVCRQRERTNKVRYDHWISKGYITKTPGDEIDYADIRRTLQDLGRRYDVRKVAFDPWNATQFAQDMQADAFRVEKFLQSIHSFNEPCKKLEELLVGKRLAHGANPVLAWMAGNAAAHTDGRGYKMPSRKSSPDKIDGLVALLMALGVAIAAPQMASVYDTRGLDVIGAGKPAPVSDPPVTATVPARDEWTPPWGDD